MSDHTLYKTVSIYILSFLIGMAILYVPSLHADTIKTITPRITIRERYDDNIGLYSNNEDSDFITTILPGVNFGIQGEKTDFELDVEGGWAFYLDDSSRDTKDYRGSIGWNQRLTEFLTFNLNDSFSQSDDPITVYDGAVVDVRGGTRTQYRNNGTASLSYQFGADDRVSAGYRNQYIDDRDEINDDRVSHVGFLNLDKWFGEQFGFGLSLSHTNGDFEKRDDFRQMNTASRPIIVGSLIILPIFATPTWIMIMQRMHSIG